MWNGKWLWLNKLSLWNLTGMLISSLQLWNSPVSLESLLLVPGASAIQEGPPGEAQEGPVRRERRTFHYFFCRLWKSKGQEASLWGWSPVLFLWLIWWGIITGRNLWRYVIHRMNGLAKLQQWEREGKGSAGENHFKSSWIKSISILQALFSLWNYMYPFIFTASWGIIWGFPGGASFKEPTCQFRRHKRHGFDPGSGRSPGEGHGNPLWYSCLENPMDRGDWWAEVHWVAKSLTWLKQLNTYPCRKEYICYMNNSLHFFTVFFREIKTRNQSET